MPAQATAKSVIASAKRLIDVRHSWRRRRRIAEISVPAWPMPIHQTKLMIAKPQPTGWLTPQMPTPFKNSQVTDIRKTMSTMKESAKPAIHHFGVRCSTTLLILSVTVAGVWPGATSGGRCGLGRGERASRVAILSPFLRVSSVSSLSSVSIRGLGRQRRVRVAQLRQVGGARPGVELLEQAVVERVRLPAVHLPILLLVVQIAEDDGARRAGLLAGGLELPGRDRPLSDLGLDLRLLDALHAVGALLHDAAHAHGDVRVVEQLEHRR